MPIALDPTEPRMAEERVKWAADVRDALTELRADERTFILASYFEGQVHSSIAQRAGLSVAEVSKIIANGMRRLAVILEARTPAVPASGRGARSWSTRRRQPAAS